jgi:uncharacterized protein YdcH (DUF465 family)
MTEAAEQEVIELLLASNEKFKQVYDEHEEWGRQVKKLTSRHSPLPADDIELHRLKKLKLATKDTMNRMIIEAQSKI